MSVEDNKKFLQSVKKSEDSFEFQEKRTLSIRLSDASIQRIEKRVDKLKKTGKLARKVTVSSYISSIVDNYALEELNEKGEL